MLVPRDNTETALTIAIPVIFRQQAGRCGRQLVRPRGYRARAQTGSESGHLCHSDCRGYSVVKCTTRRSPRVYGHTRGLRSQFTEGPECARPVSGSVGS
jgi:hypothetical protein